jgi:hypothetical protein
VARGARAVALAGVWSGRSVRRLGRSAAAAVAAGAEGEEEGKGYTAAGVRESKLAGRNSIMAVAGEREFIPRA